MIKDLFTLPFYDENLNNAKASLAAKGCWFFFSSMESVIRKCDHVVKNLVYRRGFRNGDVYQCKTLSVYNRCGENCTRDRQT